MDTSKINQLLNEHPELDVLTGALPDDENQDRDEILETLQQCVFEQEIIYYSQAMEYLAENDNSLRDSLQLAHDAGYELHSLNSETLATLHYQQALMDELSTFMESLDDDE